MIARICDVARLGRADRDPDDAGVRGRRQRRRGARRIAAPVEPIAARRPDPGHDRPPQRGDDCRRRRARARSCRIRRATGSFATAPPTRRSPPRCWTGASAAARSSPRATRCGPATTRSASPASPMPTGWCCARAAPTCLLGGVIEGEKRARWLAFGVAAGGGLLTLLITLYLLRPLARLKQRALQLIAEDADVEAGWPDLGGELGELSKVLQHVMRERKASQAAGQLLLAKMRAVMAKAPVGIAFTRNRRFELVSDEFNRLLGYEGSGLDGEAARVIYASRRVLPGPRHARRGGVRRRPRLRRGDRVRAPRRQPLLGPAARRAGEPQRRRRGNDLDPRRRQRGAAQAQRAVLGGDARRAHQHRQPAGVREPARRAPRRSAPARGRVRALRRPRRLQGGQRRRRPRRRRPAAARHRRAAAGADPLDRPGGAPRRRRVRHPPAGVLRCRRR